MKKIFLFIMLSFIYISNALAKDINTNFFELTVPSNWRQVQDIVSNKDKLSATFSNTKNGTAVIIVIKPNQDYDLKKSVDNTVQKLFSEYKVEIHSSELDNGMHVIDYTFKNAKGRYYMAMNDKYICTILITSSNIDYANELIKAISPTKGNEGLFPNL